MALLLAACGGGDGQTDGVEAAEAKVTAKEKAVAEAQTAYDESREAFCTSSQSYITAIDRYGDVFNQTEVTVGDVKTAGADLAKPGGEAESSANEALAARDDLAEAEQELADAKDALAEVTSGTSTSTTETESTGSTEAEDSRTRTTEPILPNATTDRVKQAEADFTAASDGITDQTPLAEAGAQFNAAAFALEVAWMRVYVDAGCLSEEQQVQAQTAVHDYTTDLQTSLRTAGFYDGEIDGVYGPATVDAVTALQKENGLPETGFVDRATAAALDAAVLAKQSSAASEAVTTAAAVQSTLKLAGYWDGPVDGQWTEDLTDALKAFQTELGVAPSGEVDAATLNALQRKIADAKSAATSTTAPPTTERSVTTDVSTTLPT